MTLPIPLTVRLSNWDVDRHVTRDLRSLKFRSVSPGGFASARFSLDRPLAVSQPELAYYTRVHVYDARNGSTVWAGRLEDPAASADDRGQVWELAAVGPSAHPGDRVFSRVYVDRSLERWTTARWHNRTEVSLDKGEDANGNPILRFHVPRGSVVGVNGRAAAAYLAMNEAYSSLVGQSLARVSAAWDAGVTDSNWRVILLSSSTGAGVNTVEDDTASTGGGILTGSLNGTPQLLGAQRFVYLFFQRDTSSQTIGNDNTWVEFRNIAVRGQLRNADQTLKTSGYNSSAVWADEVVADLLGNALFEFDGANAEIATTSNPIDQLAYFDGVTARKVLDDLMGIEPTFVWHAWEPNAGKYRFEWVTRPTTTTYEASLRDGYKSVDSGSDIYNEVMVRWRDVDGKSVTTVRTQTIPVLDNEGLIHSVVLDLGDEVGSVSAAQLAGDAFLADHAKALAAGQLTIARPVLNRDTGIMVQPWEIKAGKLIRVQELGRQFRVVAAEYDTSRAAATLELDAYPPSLSRALAHQRSLIDAVGRPRRRR